MGNPDPIEDSDPIKSSGPIGNPDAIEGSGPIESSGPIGTLTP